ncbi:MAG: YkgJ family cysteine cluster protein, partial [Moraxella sp.]|nr:YkgJ family cysteine cluster protein [Moraxella sp.]
MAEIFFKSIATADSDICMYCGACCANYRVSFYWAEGEALGIPEQMTVKVNDFYTCMKGTEAKPVRCI